MLFRSIRFEQHVSEISSAMTGPSGAHALAYFESIVQNTNVANKLINNLFIVYLGKILPSMKSTTIKVRICSVIGTLIRHATVIEDEVVESGLCELLQDRLKEKQESVRRKGMAALGEYLFYAATQMDDEEANAVWNVNSITVSMIVKCLNPSEDEVVKFYASKTVENIVSQSVSAGCLFATKEVASLLLEILNTSKNENMVVSASVALSHICKLNPELFSVFFESVGFNNFCGFLTDGLARIKQAFITLLLYAVKNSYPLIERLHVQNSNILIPVIAL